MMSQFKEFAILLYVFGKLSNIDIKGIRNRVYDVIAKNMQWNITDFVDDLKVSLRKVKNGTMRLDDFSETMTDFFRNIDLTQIRNVKGEKYMIRCLRKDIHE